MCPLNRRLVGPCDPCAVVRDSLQKPPELPLWSIDILNVLEAVRLELDCQVLQRNARDDPSEGAVLPLHANIP